MEMEVIQGIGSGPNAVYMPPNPVLPPPSTPLPNTPLPGRSSVADGLEVSSGGWNIETFGEYVAIAGKTLDNLGVTLPGAQGLNLAGLSSAMASGATIGALLGGPAAPLAALIGAAVAVALYVIGVFLASGGGTYSNAGPGVHAWATDRASSKFIDWTKSQFDGKVPYQTVREAAKAYLLWTVYEYGAVYVTGTGSRWYSGKLDERILQDYAPNNTDAAARELYRELGVDYDATRAIRIEMGDISPRLVAHLKAVITLPNGTQVNGPLIGANTVDAPNPGSMGDNTTGLLTAGAILAGAYAISKSS